MNTNNPFQRLYNYLTVNSDGELNFNIDEKINISFYVHDYEAEIKTVGCDIFDDAGDRLYSIEINLQGQGIVTNTDGHVLSRFRLGSQNYSDFTLHSDSMGIVIDSHVEDDIGLRIRMVIENIWNGIELTDVYHVSIWLSTRSIDIIGMGDLVKLNLDSNTAGTLHPNFPVERQTIINI